MQLEVITILVQLNSTTVNPRRKKLSYIYGLRARIECSPESEHSTHNDKITNIG